jgi:hypothetical protein
VTNPAIWLGPGNGIGMPIAGAPSLSEILTSGEATDTAAGRSYALTVPRAGLGNVTYRVSFTVDGRPSAVPMSLAGRVAMTWSVSGGGAWHQGNWTITTDPVRRVEILDGAESVTDGLSRTTSSAARGFALTTGAAAWPSGSLTWVLDDPRSAIRLARRETYDGTATAHVQAGAALDASAATADVSLAH